MSIPAFPVHESNEWASVAVYVVLGVTAVLCGVVVFRKIMNGMAASVALMRRRARRSHVARAGQ